MTEKIRKQIPAGIRHAINQQTQWPLVNVVGGSSATGTATKVTVIEIELAAQDIDEVKRSVTAFVPTFVYDERCFVQLSVELARELL